MSDGAVISCRACLTVQDSFNFFIFHDISPDVYWFCTSVRIHLEDKLTNALCDNCYHLVTKYSEFKQTCIKSQETLQSNIKHEKSHRFAIESQYLIKKEEANSEDDRFLADCDLDEKEQLKIEDVPPVDDDKDLLDVFSPITQSKEPQKKKKKIKVKLKNKERSKQLLKSRHLPNIFSFSCDLCKKKFKHLERFNAHKLAHEGKHPEIKCTTCTKTFMTWSGLQRHNESEHESTSLESLKCRICGKISKTKQTLGMHLKTHGERKMAICEVCGKGFISSFNLKEHMEIHNNQRERCYTCEQCGKKYFTKTVLRTHMKRRHTDQRYVCQICNYSFTDKYNLSKHLLLHEEKKLYSCDICSKTLSALTTLLEHKRIHSGERPFCCSSCEKCFATGKRLGEHMRTHTGDKPHKCAVCAQKFTQRGTLTRHMKIHSKMVIVEPV